MVQRICWEAQQCSVSLWRCQRENTTACDVDSCVCVCVCLCTTHVTFLSIICHTYCTVIVLLSELIPTGIFIFANMTHNVCSCVLGSQLCKCVYLCVSYKVQYVCPSCGHFTAVLNFRSALSQLSKCLFDFFLYCGSYRVQQGKKGENIPGLTRNPGQIKIKLN